MEYQGSICWRARRSTATGNVRVRRSRAEAKNRVSDPALASSERSANPEDEVVRKGGYRHRVVAEGGDARMSGADGPRNFEFGGAREIADTTRSAA